MSDMLTMIQSLGQQLRWAAELDVPLDGTTDELVVAGMGGSGVSGDFVAALIGDGLGAVSVQKGYGPLPGWVGRVRPLVVAVSYSGNTEETLDVVDDAAGRGLGIVAVTTGGKLGDLAVRNGWPLVMVPSGFQPRAALGYLFGAVSRVAGSAGVIPDQRQALEEAASLADELTAQGSRGWHQAQAIADALKGRISIIYGGGPVSGTVAARWKTQINENAKMPAWSSVLPELDHNELVGWEAMPSITRERVGIVALTDAADHPRVAARLAHSSNLTENAVPWVAKVVSEGTSEAARLISLNAMGDLTSWMMASGAGVDPVPVETIEKLKRLLADG